MNHGKVLSTSILLVMLSVTDALAAQKGLFLLGTLSQSIDLSYQFGRQDLSGGQSHRSSSQNRFQESYNFDIKYAIYNEKIMKGRLSAKARADQEYFSSSSGASADSGNAGLLYNIDAIILEQGYMPTTVFASSELTRMQNSFSPGYDVQLDSYGIGTGLRSKIVPVNVFYTSYTSETSGLAQDRTQSNDQVSISATHQVPRISETDLRIYHTVSESGLKGGGTTDNRRSFQLDLRNALTSHREKYSLNSSLNLREEKHLTKTSNLSWQEGFNWRMGRALNFGAGYSNNSSKQEDFSTGETSERSSNSGSVSLSHQLFQNLSTRLDGSARNSELADGTEREYSGNFGIVYSKKLPGEARLSLSYNALRIVVDRDLLSGEIQVVDETMTARLLEQNLLQQLFADPGSIVVRDADPLFRVAPYVEGADYRIVQNGPATELDFAITGSEIAEGRPLLISYTYLVNPSIKYQTTAQSIGSTLFLDGGYRFFASYDRSTQELLEGAADRFQLNDSTAYRAGFAAEKENFTYGIQGSYLDSTLDRSSSTEAFLRLSREFETGRMSFQARERYMVFFATESSPVARRENSFNVSVSYTRPVLRHGTAVVIASFTDSRGGSFAREDAELGGDLNWRYGKIAIKLAGKTAWRYTADTTSLENNLLFEVKRFF